jgi:hypothetical protein
MMPARLPDALSKALGYVVAEQRREWQREVEVMRAEWRADFAELRTKNAALEVENKKLSSELTRRVDEALAKVKDGEPGAPGRDGVDGRDADPETVAALIDEKVEKAIAAIPVPKDGIDGKDGADIADMMIDRDNHLVATLTDGRMKNLGVVVGRDGAAGKDGEPGAPGRDGRDGIDGVGFDDLSAEYDGERTITLRAARGDNVKEWSWQMPVVIDRGVYRDGTQYEKGDATTFGDGWRLAVKRGRDGKDAKASTAGGET